MTIAISRTDAIGDVILTIPLAGYLKEHFAGCKILFVGRTYTRAIVECSKHIDAFLNWDEISVLNEREQQAFFKSRNIDWFLHIFPNKQIAKIVKQAGIPNRVGTLHRTYHWLTCNRKVKFSRKKSDLHESQLNFKLLKPLGIDSIPSLDTMAGYYGMKVTKGEQSEVKPDPDRVNVILHPKSKGSAREWGVENFGALIELMPADKYKIFISGTMDDQNEMSCWLYQYKDKVEDITGKLSLEEFVQFIGKADVLVAASTGPLHIASALGKKAIGIYPPIRPMHPGRWKPVGANARVLVLDKECEDCREGGICKCIKAIRPEEVLQAIEG